MTITTSHNFGFFELPQGSLAIKLLGLWFGLLVFFFSPDLLHAGFLDLSELLTHPYHSSKLH